MIPGWLIKASAWYEDGDAVYGDLCEEYFEILEAKGRTRADLWFWRQGMRTCPVFLRDLFIWRMIMFKNYLKMALRSIKKRKGYAFINISGLAIGMGVCILILLWVHDELSFDAYHVNADRIYRLTIDANLGTPMKAPVSPTPAGPAMKTDYPEVLQYVRLDRPNRSPVVVGDKSYFEENVAFADNSIFEVFSFPLLKGDPKTALKTAYTAVITEDTARKYFGEVQLAGHFYRMFGPLRDGLLHHGAANQRDRHTQGARRFGRRRRFYAVQGIPGARGYRKLDCLAGGLLCNEELARQLRLQDVAGVLDFYRRRSSFFGRSPADRELPVHQSRPLQSRRLPPLRIKQMGSFHLELTRTQAVISCPVDYLRNE